MRTNWITAKPGPGARMAELRFTGRVASGGFAAGPLAVLLNAAGGARGAGEPAAEAQALRQTIASAVRQLFDLAARAESDGADILAFHLCGDAGGEPKHIEALLEAGLRALSVSPAALGRAKEAIARVDLRSLG